MSTPRDMQSLIVWLMAGIAERETAHKAMRRWREPRAIATTLAFFVAPPMRGSVWQRSVVIKSDSESLAGISQSDSQ